MLHLQKRLNQLQHLKLLIKEKCQRRSQILKRIMNLWRSSKKQNKDLNRRFLNSRLKRVESTRKTFRSNKNGKKYRCKAQSWKELRENMLNLNFQFEKKSKLYLRTSSESWINCRTQKRTLSHLSPILSWSQNSLSKRNS